MKKRKCWIDKNATIKKYTMKYLLVVAHPDDEVLGAGASMWKWSHEGDKVDVAIMCTHQLTVQ